MSLEARRATRVATLSAAAVLAMAAAGTPESPVASAANAALAQHALSDEEVLRRFLARPDEPIRSFRARRHLEVTSGALRKRAWMDVLVELDAERDLSFAVTAAGGFGLLRETVLEKVLRAEQEAYASGTSSRTSQTAENYAFAPCGRTADGLVCIAATARRKELGLLNGHFLVTPDTADIVEVSGTMARSPSFWIPRVEMSTRYARIQGHRVNLRVESVSHVRLLGESRFTMTSVYEEIENDPVFPALASARPAGP